MNPSFFLLHLPIIVIQEILSNFECVELFDFSLCSERCKRLVRITRHNFKGFCLQIYETYQFAYVNGPKGERCLVWMNVEDNTNTSGYEYMTINKKRLGMRILSSRMSRSTSSKQPEVDLRCIVDYCRDIFRIPILDVFFRPDGIQNFMKFIPMFSQCQSMNMKTSTLSEEEIESFKAQVTVQNGFFINDKHVNREKYFPRRDANY